MSIAGPAQQTHPLAPSLFFKRGGEEDFPLPSLFEKRGAGGEFFNKSFKTQIVVVQILLLSAIILDRKSISGYNNSN